MAAVASSSSPGIQSYYKSKINELEVVVGNKERNLVRLEAGQRRASSRVLRCLGVL